MKTFNKLLLTCAGTAAAVGAAGYGSVVLLDELLLNRNMELKPEIMAKISKCDMSNLDELLEKNLNWFELRGYKKYYMSSERGERLVGYLMEPEEKSDIYVLCIHGYRTGAKKEFCGFAQYYLDRGVNVFMVDNVATGESEGKYCTLGYHEETDALKWVFYMKEIFGEDIKVMIHGVSMGAATVVSLCAHEMPSYVKMAVADCGYTTISEVLTQKMLGLGIYNDKLFNAFDAVNKRRMGFSFNDMSPIRDVKNSRVPMLFVHGKEDSFVPWEMSKRLFEACASEKELLLIEGADHAQSFVDGYDKYSEKLDEWIDRYLK